MSNINQVRGPAASPLPLITPEFLDSIVQKLALSNVKVALEDRVVLAQLVEDVAVDAEARVLLEKLLTSSNSLELDVPAEPLSSSDYLTQGGGNVALLETALLNLSALLQKEAAKQATLANEVSESGATNPSKASFVSSLGINYGDLEGFSLMMVVAALVLELFAEQQDSARKSRVKNLEVSIHKLGQAVQSIKAQQDRMRSAAIAGIAIGVTGLVLSMGASIGAGMKSAKSSGVRREALDLEAGQGSLTSMAGVRRPGGNKDSGGAPIDAAELPSIDFGALKDGLNKRADSLDSVAKTMTAASSISSTLTGTANSSNSQFADSDVKGLEASKVQAEGHKQLADEAKNVDQERAQKMQQNVNDILAKLADVIRSRNEALKSASRA